MINLGSVLGVGLGFARTLHHHCMVYMSVSRTKLRTPQGKTPGLVHPQMFFCASPQAPSMGPAYSWCSINVWWDEWTNDGRNKANEAESNSTACKSKSDRKRSSFSQGHISAARAGNRNTAILLLISTDRLYIFSHGPYIASSPTNFKTKWPAWNTKSNADAGWRVDNSQRQALHTMTNQACPRKLAELMGCPCGYKIAPNFSANCSSQGVLNSTAPNTILHADPTWDYHLGGRRTAECEFKASLFVSFITQSI